MFAFFTNLIVYFCTIFNILTSKNKKEQQEVLVMHTCVGTICLH